MRISRRKELEDGLDHSLMAVTKEIEMLSQASGLTRKGDVHEAGTLKVAWFKDPGGNILSIQSKPARQRER